MRQALDPEIRLNFSNQGKLQTCTFLKPMSFKKQNWFARASPILQAAKDIATKGVMRK
jgi:hypothetical protein